MTNENADNSIKVAWRHEGTEYLSSIDLAEVEKCTPDVDGDLGATAAAMLTKRHLDLIGHCHGQSHGQLSVEIISPKTLAGNFDIAVSLSVRDETAPANLRIRPLDTESTDRNTRNEEILVGTLGYRRPPSTETDPSSTERASARLTRPEEVKFTYALLGNIYGNEIVGARNQEEEQQIGRLRELYDTAVLHGLGWPARSRASGRIGFLASHALEPGATHDENTLFKTIDKIEREHGVLPQLAKDWTPGRDVVVCFVPFDRIEDAVAISDAMNAFSEPEKTPSLPG